MRIKRKSLDNRGDTIVEVLFAVVVIALVLTGGYSVINHSTLDETDAQQHSYALELVQGQIEQLRAYLLTTKSDTFSGACMYQNLPVSSALASTDCSPQENSSGPHFGLSITQTTATPSSPTIYDINASWFGAVNANKMDNINIAYRIQ